MSQTIAPEFQRFVAAERQAQRLDAVARSVVDGQVTKSIRIATDQATELLRVAVRRAAGLYRPSKRTEVVWVEGESELAVSLVDLSVSFGDGLIVVQLAVRCDQTGPAKVDVAFACGSPNRPAGLYAATHRRPSGPALIVGSWGDALVAFAWQALLGLVTGVAGATGKDARGNVLVPVEMAVSSRGLEILPMGRHHFSGSSGLKSVATSIRG